MKNVAGLGRDWHGIGKSGLGLGRIVPWDWVRIGQDCEGLAWDWQQWGGMGLDGAMGLMRDWPRIGQDCYGERHGIGLGSLSCSC